MPRVAAVLLAAALAGLTWAATTRPTAVDRWGRPATEWASAHGLVPALRLWEIGLGEPFLWLWTALLGVALLLLHEFRGASLVTLSPLVTAFATDLLKGTVERVRPPWQVAEHAVGGGSFPSGHASTVTALAVATSVAVALVVRTRGWPSWLTPLAASGAVLVVLVTAADRVLLGRHYPTDALGGTCLGLLVASALVALLPEP